MAVKDHQSLWERVTRHSWRSLTPDEVRGILRMKFSAADVRRINALSRLAQDGALSRAERAELDEYLYVGQVMTILKAGATPAQRRPGKAVVTGRKAS